jgi:ribonuclease HII
MMLEYDALYPGYGFASHKGYAAASHQAAIAELGPCPIHRKSFRGVKEYCAVEAAQATSGATGLFDF